jgi:hypothetical protein
MADDFESLVRPFQSGDTSPSQTYYAPGDPASPLIYLRIGRNGGGGKLLTGSVSYTLSIYMKKWEVEKVNGILLPKGSSS